MNRGKQKSQKKQLGWRPCGMSKWQTINDRINKWNSIN